jgi:hypothetical protein
VQLLNTSESGLPVEESVTVEPKAVNCYDVCLLLEKRASNFSSLSIRVGVTEQPPRPLKA